MSAFSSVTIKNVTARQRYPWNGRVDISFDVVGDPAANLPERKAAKLSVAMVDRVTGRRYTAENVTGDTGPTEGAHQIVWDLAAQGIEVHSTNAVFAVAYGDNSPYRVIDVSSGLAAVQYPVSFLLAVPNGGWSDEYKTDKIVLRRIDWANGVYYAGIFEVTEAQWDKVMGGSSTSTKPKGSVSYNAIRGDAGTYDWPDSDTVDPTSFMGRLRKKAGLASLDLPSEDEWEYAARAGVTTKWLCGDSVTGLADYAWYEANSEGTVHPVGTRCANVWGLYDVHGNVSEWCLNRYFSDDVYRVYRGSSYLRIAVDCAFAYYGMGDPSDDDFSTCGFRLFCRPGSNSDDDGHNGSEIICEAESPTTFVDSRSGVRYNSGTNAVHTLSWNAAWVGGDVSAEVVIADGETELARVTGEGSCVWTNMVPGLYTITYTTFIDGVAQPEVYAADYFCLGEAGVSHVTARRILPWVGLVEIAYDLSEGVEALSRITTLFTQVRVTDNSHDEYFVARTFTRPPTYEKGHHVLIWDVAAAVVSFKTSSAMFSVAVTGEDTGPLYQVIDVSAGPDAARYPVTYLDAVPMGGWSDEYKTDKIVLRRIDWANGVYYAGVFEITEAQWDKVMGGASTNTRPKGSVSYNTIRGDAGTYDWPSSDAVAVDSFMGRLRQKTGFASLDLPSEDEWEYAARAGVTTKWLCGDSVTGLADYAWYEANSDGTVHPVGTRCANVWGLYDVHGNVYEWCLNRYLSDDVHRVMRGGSYVSGVSGCAFSRGDACGGPSIGSSNLGFRLFCRPGLK